MNKHESDALAYRLNQLENSVKRAKSYSQEAEMHVRAVTSSIENTEHDFETLRKMIKE